MLVIATLHTKISERNRPAAKQPFWSGVNRSFGFIPCLTTGIQNSENNVRNLPVWKYKNFKKSLLFPCKVAHRKNLEKPTETSGLLVQFFRTEKTTILFEWIQFVTMILKGLSKYASSLKFWGLLYSDGWPRKFLRNQAWFTGGIYTIDTLIYHHRYQWLTLTSLERARWAFLWSNSKNSFFSDWNFLEVKSLRRDPEAVNFIWNQCHDHSSSNPTALM